MLTQTGDEAADVVPDADEVTLTLLGHDLRDGREVYRFQLEATVEGLELSYTFPIVAGLPFDRTSSAHMYAFEGMGAEHVAVLWNLCREMIVAEVVAALFGELATLLASWRATTCPCFDCGGTLMVDEAGRKWCCPGCEKAAA